MIYLKQFELPSKEAEEKALHTIFEGLKKGRYGEQFFESCYPFGIFPSPAHFSLGDEPDLML